MRARASLRPEEFTMQGRLNWRAAEETVKTVELLYRTPATPLKRGVNAKGRLGDAPASAQVQQAKRKDAEPRSRREIEALSLNLQIPLCGAAAPRLCVKVPCARFSAAIWCWSNSPPRSRPCSERPRGVAWC